MVPLQALSSVLMTQMRTLEMIFEETQILHSSGFAISPEKLTLPPNCNTLSVTMKAYGIEASRNKDWKASSPPQLGEPKVV